MTENTNYLRNFTFEGLPYFGGSAPYENQSIQSSVSRQITNQIIDANNMSSPFGQEITSIKKGNPEKKNKKKNKKEKGENSKGQVQQMESKIQITNPPENKENDDEENTDSVAKVSRFAWKRNFKRLLQKAGKSYEEVKRKGMRKGGHLDTTLFYKTKICKLFLEGVCTKGQDCLYAHSQNELKEQPNLKKTKMCQLFTLGKCHLGSSCSYAHHEDELRSTPDFYKTSLCHNFNKGTCKLGSKCRFAHGESELRNGQSFFVHYKDEDKEEGEYDESDNEDPSMQFSLNSFQPNIMNTQTYNPFQSIFTQNTQQTQQTFGMNTQSQFELPKISNIHNTNSASSNQNAADGFNMMTSEQLMELISNFK